MYKEFFKYFSLNIDYEVVWVWNVKLYLIDSFG